MFLYDFTYGYFQLHEHMQKLGCLTHSKGNNKVYLTVFLLLVFTYFLAFTRVTQ